MDYLIFLSITVSIFSLLNKIFLVLSKRSGWAWGAVVGLSSAVYFFIIGLNILAVAEIGFFIVMVYGYINHRADHKKLALQTSFVLTCISVILGFYFFSSYLTFVEAVSSLSFIWGGYLLANKKKLFGWTLFIIAHVATAISGAVKGEMIFAAFQVCSGLICCYGLYSCLRDVYENKKSLSHTN